MRKVTLFAIALLVFAGAPAAALEIMKLPPPEITGGMGLHQAIQQRRSIRDYREAPISLRDVSQLLWAAQGITDAKTGHRAAPSALAAYPLNLYAVVKEGGVTGLPAGVYRYEPKEHGLAAVKKGNFYPDVVAAMSFFNNWVKKSDVVFIFTGSSTLLQKLAKETGQAYTALEAGMAAENLLLESVSLGLGRCTIGGFKSENVTRLLGIDKDLRILLIVAIGQPQ